MRLSAGFLFLSLLALSYSLGAHAQTWTKLSTTGGPTGNNGSSVVYDPSSSQIIFFGGLSGGPCCTSLNDVWLLTNANGLGGSPVWSKLSVSAPSGLPSPRSFQSAVYDSANNRMIVFGGGQFNGNVFNPLFSDVWVLTSANGIGGTPTWIPLSPLGTPPAAREGHRAVYDAINNRMIVFGGGNNGIMSVPNDLWVLTNANGLGGTPGWVQLSPTGQAPPPLERFAVAYDATSNRMTIFGGCCYWNNNTWLLTNANGLGGTPVWSPVSPSGTPPEIREVHAYGYDPALNELITFGFGGAGVSYNDTWLLSSANDAGGNTAWINLIVNNAPGSPPLPFLALDPGVYDPVSARLMLVKSEDNGQGGIAIVPWVLAPASPTQILGFPIAGRTPYSAPIVSVFDHTMQCQVANDPKCKVDKSYLVYGCDSQVQAYTAEMGQKTYGSNTPGCSGGPGYAQNSSKDSFYINGHYVGAGGSPVKGFLNYDGHPGIDYSAAYGTSVVAAVSGWVHYPTLNELQNQNMTIGGDPDLFNALEIIPSGSVAGAYRIFYLHLSTHPRTISISLSSSVSGQNFIANSGPSVPAPSARPCVKSWPTGSLSITGEVLLSQAGLGGIQVLLTGKKLGGSFINPKTAITAPDGSYGFFNLPSGWYHLEAWDPSGNYVFQAANPNLGTLAEGTPVTIGQQIGLSGNAGNCIGPHLHFEVQKQATGAEQEITRLSYIPVDPYGWDGWPQADPYPSITGGMENDRLWINAPVIDSIIPTTATANTPFNLTIKGSGFAAGVVDCLVLKSTTYNYPAPCIQGTIQSRDNNSLVVHETLTSGTYFVHVRNSSKRSNWRQLSVQ